LVSVAGKPEAELASSLDRLVRAGLLFRKGVPPHATYLFKHALVQDAAYGTLLRQPRRALHARIADALESQFADIAEAQPDLLARHYTQAGLTEKAAALWGKAGLRSVERSALVEAIEQLTNALNQIATLPGTPALRRDEIKLHVALIYPLQHVKGLAAPETKIVAERARLLIERADALGEPPEDPLLVFSALSALFNVNIVAFDGDVVRERAAQILTRAEKQGGKVPLVTGHRSMNAALVATGNFAEAVVHADRALALNDPVEHRPLATRFVQHPSVSVLMYRSLAMWALGYPEAGLANAEQALRHAQETGNPASVMHALSVTCLTQLISGNYTIAQVQSDKQIALAEEQGSVSWKTSGMLRRAGVLALTGKSSDAVSIFASAIPAVRSVGQRLFLPIWLSLLARAHGELGQFDDAWTHIGKAITAVETTKERWYEAEVHRIAGEIALKSPERDATKAEAYFERALAVARAQQAKSWELRVAMSIARLWRDQGKPDEARELLAPVYGWFTEGFDTLDLKQAKALLDELAQ
jgi:predicted ATPase